MADVAHIGALLSIRQYCAELGMNRATLQSRLAAANVQPSGKRGSYPVYRLRQVWEALRRTADGEIDPSQLTPLERRTHYQALMEAMRYETECGRLVPAVEVEQEQVRILKVVQRGLATLVDIVERETGANALMLERIQRVVDKISEDMHAEMICAENDDDAVRDSA